MQTLALLQAGPGQLSQNIWALVGLDHQKPNSIATDFLPSPQPPHTPPTAATRPAPAPVSLNKLISLSHVLNYTSLTRSQLSLLPSLPRAGPILPIERRLAEIAELIPISLLHVDAINQAKSRSPAVQLTKRAKKRTRT
ncbi:hypothetical protein PTTG_31025 [Puccinia triticina 1-1 BBBD Race 1]|uniref:Uncharacterized protein n=1 Tax=Puccinia triticina (isolate 1-1 / race 1 (BBBD)) TaxID=630390 RepID=A0A180FWF5_PUCT1|nr:hypothetical protein PTTG_31025 [Puccinia triticina 1-1 BBBD Race 1]